MKATNKVLLLVVLVLLIDQLVKFWVKINMSYGEEILIFGFEWARIHFVENNGMAFGLSLGGEYGKLALSLFRIFAVGFLVYYIRLLAQKGAGLGLLISFGLILAGALGNILDSAFYGLIFSESYHGQVAELFPADGGYATFLHGKVVDMLYFPMFRGVVPEWVPFWGGEPFLFFKPVFNIADMSISIGVLNILIFQRSFFSGKIGEEEQSAKAETTSVGDNTEASTTHAGSGKDSPGVAKEISDSNSDSKQV